MYVLKVKVSVVRPALWAGKRVLETLEAEKRLGTRVSYRNQKVYELSWLLGLE